MKGLSNMETKRLSSKVEQDMAFGQPLLITTCPDDDAKGNIDFSLVLPKQGRMLKIALRSRRISIKEYGEVSIRYQRENGAKTEYAKLLAGECQSDLFVFPFKDAWVLCLKSEILRCLKANIGQPKDNHDGTWAWYIPISQLNCFVIEETT